MARKIEFGPVYPTMFPRKFRTEEQDRHFEGVWQMQARKGKLFIKPRFYFSSYPAPDQLEAAKSWVIMQMEDVA